MRFLENPYFVPELEAPPRHRRAGARTTCSRTPRPASSSTHAEELLAYRAAALRARGKELPDRRDRLHRRAPPLGRGRDALAERLRAADGPSCRSRFCTATSARADIFGGRRDGRARAAGEGRSRSERRERRRKRRSRREFTIVNQRGLHARAATKLVQLAGSYPCEVTVVGPDGQGANAKSVMGVLLLCGSKGTVVEVRRTGAAADEASTPSASSSPTASGSRVTSRRSGTGSRPRRRVGDACAASPARPASPSARPSSSATPRARPAAPPHRRPTRSTAEIERFEAARRARAAGPPRAVASASATARAEASILEAYLLMVGDETLADAVRAQIRDDRRCAEWAVVAAIDSDGRRSSPASTTRTSASAATTSSSSATGCSAPSRRAAGVLATDAADDRARSTRRPPSSRAHGPTIIVAHDLSPGRHRGAWSTSRSSASSPRSARARATRRSWRARSRSRPSSASPTRSQRIRTGDTVIVDGLRGAVIVRPTDRRCSPTRKAALATAPRVRPRPARSRATAPATTKDGVARPPARQRRAPGRGDPRARSRRRGHRPLPHRVPLHRSRRAAERGRAVRDLPRGRRGGRARSRSTLRTFDIGGDKFASHLPGPARDEPDARPARGAPRALAARRVPRAAPRDGPRLARTATCGSWSRWSRASTSCAQVRALLDAGREPRCARAARPAPSDIPLGVMIEVPAAAVMVDVFAQRGRVLQPRHQRPRPVRARRRSHEPLARVPGVAVRPVDPAPDRRRRARRRASAIARCRSAARWRAIRSRPSLLVGLGPARPLDGGGRDPRDQGGPRRVTLGRGRGGRRPRRCACHTAEEVEHAVAQRSRRGSTTC